MPDGARTWDRYDAARIGPPPVVVRKRESSSIEHENGAATNCLSVEHGPENRQEASVSLVGAPTLYDNPGLQSPPDEPEILVRTRRPALRGAEALTRSNVRSGHLMRLCLGQA